ncbi:RNA-binding protein [Spirosoma arcticum]
MKRLWIGGVAVVAMLSLASCDYQKYNTIRQADVRAGDYDPDYQAGDEEVYGKGKDSAAVQSTYKYTPNPALEERTQKIRDKLFGTGTIGEGA